MGRTSDAREQLLDSACELIHARGYHSVGVQELCEHAGVKKGSFYHFFHTKQELVLAMLDRQWERMRSELLDPCFAPDVPPLARIRRFVAATCESFEAEQRERGVVCGCPFGNLSLEMSTEDEGIRLRLDEIYRGWTGYVEAALQEAVDTGEVPDLDVALTAESIVAFVSGVALLAKVRNRADLAARLSSGMDRFLRPAAAAV